MIHRMTLLPVDLYMKSVVVCPMPRSIMWINEILEVLGTNLSLIYVPIDEYIFVKNLYTVLLDWKMEDHDAIWHSFYGEPVWIFAETIRKRFGYNDVKPFRYVLTNRERTVERWISNLPELKSRLKEKYPKINFEIIGTTWKTLSDNVKDVVEIQWMFYVTGSNAMRFVFMSPGTVAVQYMTECFEPQQFSMFTSRGVYVVSIFNRFLKHYTMRPIILNIDWALIAVNRSLYTLKTQSLLGVNNVPRFPEKIWKSTPRGDVFVTQPKFVKY